MIIAEADTVGIRRFGLSKVTRWRFGLSGTRNFASVRKRTCETRGHAVKVRGAQSLATSNRSFRLRLGRRRFTAHIVRESTVLTQGTGLGFSEGCAFLGFGSRRG